MVCLICKSAFPLDNRFEHCFNQAALHYSIPPNLLKTIAIVESKMNPSVINISNNNGTIDIGLMQVNSSWVKKLNRIGISQTDLLDGCINIQVGAWILAQNIKRYGLTAEAIGRYNSPNSYYKSQYIKNILKTYKHNISNKRF